MFFLLLFENKRGKTSSSSVYRVDFFGFQVRTKPKKCVVPEKREEVVLRSVLTFPTYGDILLRLCSRVSRYRLMPPESHVRIVTSDIFGRMNSERYRRVRRAYVDSNNQSQPSKSNSKVPEDFHLTSGTVETCRYMGSEYRHVGTELRLSQRNFGA